MNNSSIQSLKIKAKLLQKKKRLREPDYALKDAYQLLAQTAGYQSWKEMKDATLLADILNPPRWSAIWKTWFSNYEEALALLGAKQFLLPYKKQYFICDGNYLAALGIQVNDPLVSLIGNNWVQPKNQAAFNRLIEKIKQHLES